MKNLSVIFLLLGCGLRLHAQYVYTITADSVKLTSCDSSELIIMNHTQAVPGFLFNTGNGRTVFKRALTTGSNGSIIIGADTLNAWMQGGNRWGAPGVLGTLDSNTVNFYTNNTHRAQLTGNGTFSTDSDAVFHNVRVGIGAARNPTATVVGISALMGSPSGNGSIAIGYGAGEFATQPLTAIGYDAGMNASGTSILLGPGAGEYEKGNSFIGIGWASGLYMNGGYDIGIGAGAMDGDSVTGWGNIALGDLSAQHLSTGGYNTLVGQQVADSLKTGSYNIVIGALTGGNLQTGNYNTIIGSQVANLSPTMSNSIVLADGQGFSRMFASAVGDVGVGTTSPHSLFQVTQPASNGTGTASVAAGTGTVVGIGTEFTNTFKIGDSITITTIYSGYTTSETHVVTAIASDVSMTTTPFSNWQQGAYTISSREVLAVKGNGNIGIATDAPTSKVDVTGVNGYSQLRLRTSYTPTSSSDPNGNVGDFSWDGNYIYIKTSAGWMRSALNTF